MCKLEIQSMNLFVCIRLTVNVGYHSWKTKKLLSLKYNYISHKNQYSESPHGQTFQIWFLQDRPQIDLLSVCILIVLSGKALQSCSVFMCTRADNVAISKYKNTLCNQNINMLSFIAGESLSRKVQMFKSGGTAYYSLFFHFGCCSCATDKL